MLCRSSWSVAAAGSTFFTWRQGLGLVLENNWESSAATIPFFGRRGGLFLADTSPAVLTGPFRSVCLRRSRLLLATLPCADATPFASIIKIFSHQLCCLCI